MIVARLNDRAQPMDRGELYEDPLFEFLEEQGLGSVSGGGTLMGKNGEIEFCDVEILAKDNSAGTIKKVITTLESLGAPKGSKLIIEGQKDVPFGKFEGLAVYLNGTDLPDDVYAECDSNHIYGEFNRLLGKEGKIHSHWQGPTETGLYMYGKSFETMKARLVKFMATYPLCAKARVVKIA
ncbi:MAG TPA: hypothetical protein VM680_07025 [Verrucomicrobiae bacterium]|nr:hypothetical protein [Verrucomicrobiae bacterium]